MEDMYYPITSINNALEISEVDPLSVHGEVFYCDDDDDHDVEIEEYPAVLKSELQVIVPCSSSDPSSNNNQDEELKDDDEDEDEEDEVEVEVAAPSTTQAQRRTDFSEVDEDIKMLREVEMIEVLSEDDDEDEDEVEDEEDDEDDVDVESVPIPSLAVVRSSQYGARRIQNPRSFKYPRVPGDPIRPDPKTKQNKRGSRTAGEPVRSNPKTKQIQSGFQYPRVVDIPIVSDRRTKQGGIPDLTEDEKKTLKANGFPIPKRLPLTREEEKALKLVRRRIRNKILSQESRDRQRNYLKELEERLAALMNENLSYKKKVHFLEIKNRQLTEELERLKIR